MSNKHKEMSKNGRSLGKLEMTNNSFNFNPKSFSSAGLRYQPEMSPKTYFNAPKKTNQSGEIFLWEN